MRRRVFAPYSGFAARSQLVNLTIEGMKSLFEHVPMRRGDGPAEVLLRARARQFERAPTLVRGSGGG
jgi:hypothetical protein